MKFNNENEYKQYLEKHFFPQFFDDNWKKEYPVRVFSYYGSEKPSKERIDYFGYRNKKPTYVEIKNDRIRQKYLLQIVRYYCQISQEHEYRQMEDFDLIVICIKKIRPHREKILNKLGIKILDIDEVCNGGLDKWM